MAEEAARRSRRRGRLTAGRSGPGRPIQTTSTGGTTSRRAHGPDLQDPKLLLRDDVVADPRPLYDALRRRAPVWQLPGQQTYLVSDPALIRDAVARPGDFSSNLVSLLHRGADGTPVQLRIAAPGDAIHVLATADPPVHTRHRRLLQPHLNAVAVASLEPWLHEVVERQIAPMLAAGRGDAVEQLSDPLPAMTICRLVGLPEDDAFDLIPVVADIGPFLDGLSDLEGMASAAVAVGKLHEYIQTRLDAALARPADERSGLLGVLGGAVDSGAIDADEARNVLTQIFSAGSETTSGLIATTIETLARDHDLQGRLRSDPAQIPDALDDVLRDDGPFQFHYRWSTTDTTLGDVPIPAGSVILLMWAAANRPAPAGSGNGREDVGDGGLHFAFGRGLHFCVGAPLARLESRIAIEGLLLATSRIALDPQQPPVRRRSIFLRRHASLPVVLERA